ncbi:MAG: TIR domain-containing protein [Gemmatimonadaceae bacterium]
MNSPGDTIQQYRLLRRNDGALWKLARESWGVTYKAVDTDLEQSVAVTLVDVPLLEAERTRTEVMRRARSLMQLSDERVAQLFYVGIDGERVVVARPYVEGESIAQYVKRKGAIGWEESLQITLDVARALDAATQRSVVHGNIAPAAVILTGRADEYRGRSIRLIDFALTNVEQFNARSDIRALGEVLRTMLLGSLPPHEAEMFSQQRIPGIEYQYPNAVPSPVVDLVKQMTSADEKSGPSTAAQLIKWISEFLAGPPTQVIPQSAPEGDGPEHAPGQHMLKRERYIGDSAVPADPLEDNLQFTAYRPKVIRPNVWTKMLVFAHLDERPSWLNEDERSPHEEVIAQAQQLLGEKFDEYRHSTDDSRLAVPRDGEITMLPEVPGIEFNPPRRSFFWRDGIAVHPESFDMRASNSIDGQTARGRLTIFLGRIILAEITLAIRVDRQYVAEFIRNASGNDQLVQERSASRAFRKVFASYSHRDLGIVEEMERHARSFGDEYLRDWVHLRSGEQWHDGLQQLIRAADVFQLFWSPNSARSEFVEQEWQYALGLGRDTFVRPTYWQDPMPDPPAALRPLHFHRLAVAVSGSAPAAQPSMTAAPMPTASTAPAPMSTAPRPAAPTPAAPMLAAPPPPDRPKRSISVLLVLFCAVILAMIVSAIFRR